MALFHSAASVSRVLDTVVVYRDARLKRDIVHLLSNSVPAVTSKMSAGEKGLDTFQLHHISAS